ncbi:uncharacterized protein LOC142976270 [Anticarsia gemmatalis]|uniref:uncharacterized protein LOC142976270 n=1 Tax=Anticarsia gemmatalis TaxID=129554 RepID=UPI003F76BD2E
MVRVQVNEGVLEGEVMHNKHNGGIFCSFKGIPYAQPPLGDLRFKAPQPPKPWEGVREAKEFGGKCYQFDVFTRFGREGTEDCLYLNVYTPTITPAKPLPVMIFIHGGAFVGGSGEDDFYGPQFLVNKGVILVTINYRLEVLGYLCLNSEDVPGNAGMKDQVAALRWVNKNIANFGGDPNNVTIFGESAGGVSTSYHCISPMTKGLFKRAIIMSGVSNCHWALAWEPRERALALARQLGCYSEDDKELYEFFKKQPIESLIQAQTPIMLSEKAQTKIEGYFSVVDEKKFGDNERFFYGDMFDVLSEGIHEGVEVMVGYTSDEGLINLGPDPDTYKNRLDMARNFPEFFVSKPLSLRLPIYQQLEFGKKMRNFYFKNPIKYEDWEQMVKFYSMDIFVNATLQWIKAVAMKGQNKLYVYKFSCTSERNVTSKMTGLEALVKDKPVCCHADDLTYLFDAKLMPGRIEPDTFRTIEMVSKIWTDFAKNGDPTPDNPAETKWEPYTIKNQNYMDIGNVLKPGTAPDQEEQEFWVNLFREYGQRVFCKMCIYVRVNEGILEGEKVQNKYGGTLCSFKGVPYAQPPLEDLRFKAPLPPKPWQGVRSAKAFGPKCYQYDWFTGGENQGSEDCLYLNVYTPDTNPTKPLPVMFWIHGGAFVSGSGEDDFFGPEFLVRQGVILVTINYRLEILGFLCLNTADVPGNAGMKDQVQALRWVNDNIAKFGGDPRNITIFGESAGSASVTYHLMSPMTKGLFQKAIAQSGVCMNHWAQGFESRKRALKLAKKLGCNSEDLQEVYEFFKKQPVENLVNAKITVSLAEESVIDKTDVYFSVVSEQKFDVSERFFYGDVIDNVCNNIHEGVDIMAGYTSDEGLIMIKPGDYIKKHLELASSFPEYFVTKPITLNLPMIKQFEMGEKIRQYYFGDQIAIPDDWFQLAKYFAMDMLGFSIMQWAKFCSNTKRNKLYIYKFSCKSERNKAAEILGIGDIVGDRPVTNHLDDLMYIFDAKALKDSVDVNSLEYQLIDKVTKIWTNFAKYGNPTPDNSLGVQWTPYSVEGQDYLDIGNKLVPGTAPDRDEIQFWENLFKEYGQRVFE